MNKQEAVVLFDEVGRACEYIKHLCNEAREGSKRKKKLEKIDGKCRNLHNECTREFNQEIYGNLATYCNQAAELVAEASKTYRDLRYS